MKRIGLLVFFMSVICFDLAQAQCTTTGQFPAGTQTLTANAPSSVHTIATCNFTTEHSAVTGFMAGSPYTAAISPAGHITINSGTPTGPLVASGPTPLSFVAPNAGPFYFHWTDNDAPTCGGTVACFTTTITNNTFPTPVEYESFTANLERTGVKLNWRTLNEQNNSHFNIQRSLDGENFKTIARENSQAVNGQSGLGLSYTYLDEDASLGRLYYRLQQLDLDGQTSLSPVQEVYWNNSPYALRVYPNPAQNEVNAIVNLTASGRVKVNISDLSGRTMLSEQLIGEAGQNIVNLDLDGLTSGLYFLSVELNSNSIYRERFVIRK